MTTKPCASRTIRSTACPAASGRRTSSVRCRSRAASAPAPFRSTSACSYIRAGRSAATSKAARVARAACKGSKSSSRRKSFRSPAGKAMTSDLRLGLTLGYWGPQPPEDAIELAKIAERFGYDSVWTAEAYGSDVFTPLAWVGAHTKTIKLGTGIVQISARTPVATAMHAMTLDHLSGGRLLLGLGVSGPQVVEGWYGQPFPKPLARTREYVEILRRIFRREEIDFEGVHYQMPLRGGSGLGKPLKSIVKPLREDIPIVLGAEGPKNVAMAAEIADGWLPIFFSPKSDAFYRTALEEGFARPDARRSW